ncbi:MAG: hypothetical protein CVU03_06820 [Bacteroidetes bacterium HGW-Bacteroidetes-2]|jgi:hypothetical protein|nr:MAG: hypothetical protein CVU03_06820 [Bacteroidetes bacterium HGW-Bacteroidetes-2]
MKYSVSILVIFFLLFSCDSTKNTVKSNGDLLSIAASDTLRIANDSIEYEIIIIEPGFNSWLISQPPKTFYGIDYLETRNQIYVSEYNRRVYSPGFSKRLYEQEINYDPNVRYGLEVNYLLFNYFNYFEVTYKQKLR